jgi:hypothetical protein
LCRLQGALFQWTPLRTVTAQSAYWLGYRLENRGSRVQFPVGAVDFLFTATSRTALRPTQPPFQWVPGVLTLGVKRLGNESDHSPPSSAKIKEWMELYLHSPIRLHGRVLSLKNAQRQLYLYTCLWWSVFSIHELYKGVNQPPSIRQIKLCKHSRTCIIGSLSSLTGKGLRDIVDLELQLDKLYINLKLKDKTQQFQPWINNNKPLRWGTRDCTV